MSSYGDSKKRDMARSILPCSSRKTYRDLLAITKRASRSRVNQELGFLVGASEDVLDRYEDSAVDYNQYPNREINSLVWDRRDHDKVAPVMKWAVAVTEGVRQEDRLSRFAAMMPDNTIGRHAVDHVSWMDEFDDGSRPNRWSYSKEAVAERRLERNIRIAELVERMELLFEKNGALKKFNQSEVAYRLERKPIEHIRFAESLGLPRWKVLYDRRANEYYYLTVVKAPLTMKSKIGEFLQNFALTESAYYHHSLSKFEKLDEVLKKIGV